MDRFRSTRAIPPGIRKLATAHGVDVNAHRTPSRLARDLAETIFMSQSCESSKQAAYATIAAHVDWWTQAKTIRAR